MTHTKDKLAAALRSVFLNEMAEKAEQGYYHDFLSPLDFPEIQLVNDLREAALACPGSELAGKIMQIRFNAMNGEYDASKEESDEWAASPEGRAAFSMLIPKERK